MVHIQPVTEQQLMTLPGLFARIRENQIEQDELDYQRRLLEAESQPAWKKAAGIEHTVMVYPDYARGPRNWGNPEIGPFQETPHGEQIGWEAECACGQSSRKFRIEQERAARSFTCRYARRNH